MKLEKLGDLNGMDNIGIPPKIPDFPVGAGPCVPDEWDTKDVPRSRHSETSVIIWPPVAEIDLARAHPLLKQ